jgi:transposase
MAEKLAKRLLLWIRRKSKGTLSYLVNSDDDPLAGCWDIAYSYRVAVSGVVAYHCWLDGTGLRFLTAGYQLMRKSGTGRVKTGRFAMTDIRGPRISLSAWEVAELRTRRRAAREAIWNSRSAEIRMLQNALLDRIRILELAHEGLKNSLIAQRLDRHPEQIRRVISRYRKNGLASLDAPSGRPVDRRGRVEILATVDLIREQHEPTTLAEYARLLNLYLTPPLSLPTIRRHLRAAGLRFRVQVAPGSI